MTVKLEKWREGKLLNKYQRTVLMPPGQTSITMFAVPPGEQWSIGLVRLWPSSLDSKLMLVSLKCDREDRVIVPPDSEGIPHELFMVEAGYSISIGRAKRDVAFELKNVGDVEASVDIAFQGRAVNL